MEEMIGLGEIKEIEMRLCDRIQRNREKPGSRLTAKFLVDNQVAFGVIQGNEQGRQYWVWGEIMLMCKFRGI